MVNKVKNIRGAGGGSGSGGEIEADTLFTNTIGKGIFIFSEGPTGGPSTGDGKSIYLNDVPLMDSTGATTAKGVSWTWRDGLPDQTYIDGYPAAVSYQNVGVNVLQATPHSVTIANGSDNYDAAYVVVAIPTLVFKSAKGNLRKTNIAYRIQVKANGGSWVTQHDVNFTAKASSQWEGTYRVELPVGGSPWEVRLVRVSPDSDTGPAPNGEMYSNETHFARYATITDGKFTYRNSAALGIQFNAKEYGDSIPNVKVKMKGIKVYVPTNYDPETREYATSGAGTSGGIWDGTFKAAITNNPMWIYHDLLINNRYGLGQDFNPSDDPETSFVDKWALYSLAQYCDEEVDDGRGGVEPRFTINCQITNRQEAYDLLQNIIASVNGMLYFSAEQVVAVADRPQTIVDAFTQADVEGGLFEYAGTALKTRHSVCIVNFKDPENLYKTSNIIFEDPDYIQEIGYRVTEVDAFGCTSRAQALRLARWTLRTERTQTQTVSFQTGLRGGLLKPGQIIKVFDDYKSGIRMGGRILASELVGADWKITFDQTISYDAAGATLHYLTEDGELHTKSIGGPLTSNYIWLAESDPRPLVGATWALVKPSLDGQQFRVLVVEEDDDGKYIVSALQHDENKFVYIDSNIIVDAPKTSVLSANALATIEVAAATPYYEEVSGTQAVPKVTISWEKPVYANDYPIANLRGQVDDRIVEFELELLTPWGDYETVYTGSQTSWSSPTLEIDDEDSYGARIRGKDQLGRTSSWFYLEPFSIIGKDIAPEPPSNLVVEGIINGIAVSWDIPVIADYKYTEVYVNSANTQVGSTLIAEITDDFYILSGVEDDAPRYFFIRTVSHNLTNNTSTFVSGSATRKTITVEDTDFIGTGATNPASGTEGELFFNTTDGKLYRYHSGAWTAAVPTVDLTGTITGAQISAGAVGLTNFASGLTPIEIVGSLPVSGNFEGRTVAYAGKLYRYTSGAFTATVAAGDITGQVTNSQIASIVAAKISDTLVAGQIPGLDTSKIISGTFDTTRFADGAITAAKFATGLRPIEIVASLPVSGNFEGRMVYLTTDDKLYRHNGTTFISAVAAADVTGQLTSAQIASITAAQISTTLAAGQIPGLDSSKIISGQFDGSRIADGAINSAKLAAGLSPIEIMASLPVSGNYEGRMVYLTTDDKLYRYNGSAFISAVAASDVTGTLTAGQIATLTAGQITGQLTNSQIADLAASKVTGQLTSSQIVSVTAGQVTGQITNSQIASITAAKISDTLVAGQIPGLDTSKIISGTFDATRLADGIITAAKFAAGLTPIEIVATLPVTNLYSGRTVYLTSDGKLYRYAASAWTAAVAATDVTGQITSTQITDDAITTPKIAANAVTADEIAANAITAVKIAAGVITGDKLVAGTIQAAQIAAGAITTDKLLVVGSSTSVNHDPLFADTTAWQWPTSGTQGFKSISDGAYGTKVYWTTNDTGAYPTYATSFPIDPTKDYKFETTVRRLSGNRTFYGFLNFYDNTGALIPHSGHGWTSYVNNFYYPVNLTFPNTDWITSSVDFGPNSTTGQRIPSNAVRAGIGALLNYPGGGTTTDGEMQLNMARVVERVQGSLIVDGAITANKILASAITSDKIAANAIIAGKIAAGVITATEIATDAITAAKILAGAVGADEIAANAITSVKIAANAITADKILAGTISASKLAVGDTSNMYVDSNFTEVALYNGTATKDIVPTADNIANQNYLRLSSANDSYKDAYVPDSLAIVVEPGQEYFFSVAIAAGTGITASVQAAWYAMNEAGVLSYISGPTIASTTSPALSKQTLIATAPANARRLKLIFTRTGGAGNTALFGEPVVRRAAAGELIVDGAIIASKISAGAIETDKLAANAVTAAKIAANTITANEIAAGAITTDELAANAVTAVKIAAGTITATQIASATITGDRLVAGTIQAAQIAAGAITTEKMIISSGNLIANSDFATGDFTNWKPWGNPAYQSVVAASAGGVPANAPTKYVAKYTYTGAATTVSTFYGVKAYSEAGADRDGVSVTEGEQYNVSIAAAKSADMAGNFYVILYWIKSDGTYNNSVTAISNIPLTTSWATYNGSWTVPAGAVRVSTYIYWDNATAGSVYWTGVRMTRKADGLLVVDGAITADKIATGAITAGKIAAGVITATEIATDAITAIKIQAGAVGADEIAANAITSVKISAGSITGDRLTAGTITATQIATGTITAAQIAANTIVASKLILTDSSNMYVDPSLVDASIFDATGGSWSSVASTDTVASKNQITITGSGTYMVRNKTTYMTPVEPSKPYYVSTAMWTDGTCLAYVFYTDAAGTILASTPVIGSQGSTPGAIQRRSITITTPSNARGMGIWFEKNTGTYAVFAEPVIRRAANAELIVDGSIVAAKIAANTITAGQIAAGTITSTQIATDTITATNIAAGAIGVDELAANSVTAAKIVAGTITATQIATDTITSAQIATGAITAAEIAAGAITTAKMAIGDFSNLIQNGSFGDGAATVSSENWIMNSWGLTDWSVGNGAPAKYAAFINCATYTGWQGFYWNKPIPCQPGEVYNLSYNVTGGGVVETYPHYAILDKDGNQITQVGIAAHTGSSTWTTASFNLAPMPTGSAYIMPQMYKTPSATGYIYITNVKLRRAMTGELVVDGAITAAKIAAGTITANEIAANTITAAKIAANTITAAQIAADTITSGQIATGAITANEVAALAITASKLSIGDTSNMYLDPEFMGDTELYVYSTVPTFTTTTENVASKKAMSISAAGSVQSATTAGLIPVEANKPYFFHVAMWTNATALCYVIWRDTTGAYIDTPLLGSTTSGAITRFNSIHVAPSNARYVGLYFEQTGSGTSHFAEPIVRRAANGELIVDGTITAAKIAANTITAGQIAAGTITATQIAAGTITGTQIAANTITANKLIVGGGGYINRDPMFNDATVIYNDGGSMTLETVSDAPAGGRVLRSGTTFNGGDYSMYAIDPLKSYRFRFWARKSATANGVLYGTLRQYTNSSGTPCATNGGRSPYKPSAASPSTTWTEYSATFGPADWQANVKYVALDWLLNYGGTLGYMEIAYPRLEELVTGELIVNGTITATQIAAGTITANEIAANTITAAKLSVSSLSAIAADIGTVTAGTIRNSGSSFILDVTNGRITTVASSYVKYEGAGFGVSSDLIMWYGPSSTAIGSTTKTNGVFALATDGKTYYGANEIGGRYMGQYSGDAAANSAGLNNGDMYVDTSVFPPVLKGKIGGTITEISETGILNDTDTDVDIVGTGTTFTDMHTYTLPAAISTSSFFTVQVGMGFTYTTTVGGSTTIPPAGSWQLWEYDASLTDATKRMIHSGTWAAQINAGGPNPTYVNAITVDGDEFSDISRQWKFKFGGGSKFVLKMHQGGGPNISNAKTTIRVAVQRN